MINNTTQSGKKTLVHKHIEELALSDGLNEELPLADSVKHDCSDREKDFVCELQVSDGVVEVRSSARSFSECVRLFNHGLTTVRKTDGRRPNLGNNHFRRGGLG